MPDFSRWREEKNEVDKGDWVFGDVEAAEILGICPSTLRKRVARGEVRRYKNGRKNRYKITDLHSMPTLEE